MDEIETKAANLPWYVSAVHGYFSQRAMELFTFVDFVLVYTIISVLGMVTNVINVIIFRKMGVKDTVNKSLLVLSVTDLLYLLYTLLISLCYYPIWGDLDLNFNVLDLSILTVGWPEFYFRRAGNWVTAFITFERCLCTALPLKVKVLITPRRTNLILAAILCVLVLIIMPAYFAVEYQCQFDTSSNRTYVILVYHNNSAEIDSVTTAISFVFTIATFIFVIVCTVILVTSLRFKSKWRQNHFCADKTEMSSVRDLKVIKMVVSLSIIFILALIPDVAVMLTMTFDHRVSFYGEYVDLYLVLNGVSEPVLALNAALNILVYLKMSSKYRDTFSKVFGPV
ncbi:neurotensin receptor type 2-like [Physella acuta]|uniref:neurotensin receptor type 2-like n=1 Tax=Physella acuta TaxID=109671 RepID=UPI0027DB6E03|nr:neurotensin receptor type 2-like [Physella acuta]